MKRVYQGKIGFAQYLIDQGDKSNFRTFGMNEFPEIVGLDNYSYETTVENIQSTLLVHEWYTHGLLKQGSFNFQHAKAYQNVILHPSWYKTTDYYKKKMVENLKFYLRVENNQGLEGIWLETYNFYINCK